MKSEELRTEELYNEIDFCKIGEIGANATDEIKRYAFDEIDTTVSVKDR